MSQYLQVCLRCEQFTAPGMACVSDQPGHPNAALPCRPAASAPVYARLIPAPDQATVHRTLVLDLLQDHRRVQNVRSCSARGCAWHPSPVGRNGDPDAMRTRHHLFNQHLADLIVAALQPPGVLAPADLDSGHAPGPHAVTAPSPAEVAPPTGERPSAH